MRKKDYRRNLHLDDMTMSQKLRYFSRNMAKLIRYFASHRGALAAAVICAVLSTAFSVVSPAVLGRATDVVVDGAGRGGVDFHDLGRILLLLVILYLSYLAFSYLQGWIMAGVSQKVIYSLRRDMSEKMDRLPLRYFDRQTHGEIQSRMINDIETINSTLSVGMTQMITAGITVGGIVIMMLSISVLMTVTVLLILPLSAFAVRFIVARTQGYFRQQQDNIGRVNSHVEEMFTGHDTVNAYNCEERTTEIFDRYNEALYRSSWKSQTLSGIMMPVTTLIGYMAYVAVCLLGGFLAVRGRMSIGSIQAFIHYVINFNNPVSQLASLLNQFQSTAAAAERIFDFLEEEEEGCDDPEAVLDPSSAEGRITFENVTFGYGEEPVIEDFSFEAAPGERIAVVGPTGAGKTTIVKLLMRFYETDGGAIRIDGHDIRSLSRDNVRDMFAMVLQDTWLRSGTVRENIRYGRAGASDEDVERAAEAAHIDHFINTRAGGYDMEIGEVAENISQGQKQLMTIARAVLKDAPVLILDEATSSVDTRTEILIQRAMDRLMKGRTSFIIAHRLSTIRSADRIIVMDKGRIVQWGTHDELMERGGLYRDIYMSQFS